MHRVLALGLTVLSGTALAESTREHRGLFLRLTGGVGFMSMEADDADLLIDGGSGTLGLSLGGAVVENLAVYGDLLMVGIGDMEGHHRVSADEKTVSAGVAGIGPGVSYYFMPINLYVGGSVVVAAATVTTEELDRDERERRSEAGLGVSLLVGKEWWVSSNWAVGAAARVFGATFEDHNIVRDGSRWRVGALSVLLSVTYN